jgi:ribosomal protein L11 methyltransferase
MCLELLLELDPGGSFADLGCGSGVLGIAAAKLGWEPVCAVDFEAASVEAARANAAANGVAIEVARADLRREAPPAADTVVANLLRPLLAELVPALAPARTLVVSGLLRAEAGDVAAAFGAHGLSETARREAGDWSALLLVREDGTS